MLSEYASDGIPKDLSSVISVMIQKMNDFWDRLFILLGNGGDPNFLPMVRNTFIEHLPLPFPNKGYVISYITSALVGVLIYWYETGKKDSLETVANQLLGIIDPAPDLKTTNVVTERECTGGDAVCILFKRHDRVMGVQGAKICLIHRICYFSQINA